MNYGRAGSRSARLREWCHGAVDADRAEGTIPTTGRFLFYEAVMAGDVAKHATGARRADQVVTDALTWLRERGAVGWDEIADRTRHVNDFRGARTVRDAVIAFTNTSRLDPWDGAPPLVIVESESLAGLFEDDAYEYRVVLVPVRGQCSASMLFNDVAHYVHGGSEVVLYVGDHDKAGYDIEASARERLEEFTGRALKWERVALTAEQVEANGLPLIPRTDGRDGLTRLVAECEAMPQAQLMALVRDALADLLPEPLDRVHERERIERASVRRQLGRSS